MNGVCHAKCEVIDVLYNICSYLASRVYTWRAHSQFSFHTGPPVKILCVPKWLVSTSLPPRWTMRFALCLIVISDYPRYLVASTLTSNRSFSSKICLPWPQGSSGSRRHYTSITHTNQPYMKRIHVSNPRDRFYQVFCLFSLIHYLPHPYLGERLTLQSIIYLWLRISRSIFKLITILVILILIFNAWKNISFAVGKLFLFQSDILIILHLSGFELH